MFHSIEKYRTPAQVLLGLIALTFVGFGVSTVSHPGADYIVQVGDEKISDHSINNAIQNEQADGGGPSRDAVFQSLLQRAYLKQGAKLLGISVLPNKSSKLSWTIPISTTQTANSTTRF
ncbi:peptidyl-prolyl cis-trans isomerase D domain protein [Neisseria meningitidis 992008]|nr:peptidyl-prolyl cis-trans isomerase D domain protein [Neisseria meningitidis 992008]